MKGIFSFLSAPTGESGLLQYYAVIKNTFQSVVPLEITSALRLYEEDSSMSRLRSLRGGTDFF